MNIAGHTIFTITQLSNQVKFALERDYDNLWVRGEIASCKPYPSGHIYMTLKDEQSELSAVVFSQHVHQLSSVPQIGQKVTVNGSLSLYSPKGKFQFQIRNIYPTGQGELWMAYEALKEQLQAEGLFDHERKKDIPKYPSRIGIITSSKGAALRDILQVLKRRAPHLSCIIYPVPVQGRGAGEQISRALDTMNEYGTIDALILGRGGGSMEDLWCFNDEKVVRSIYSSNIPVISAVGHETDTTLSDYAADLRAATPSAAAELVSKDRLETIQLLDYYSEILTQSVFQKIIKYRDMLGACQQRHGFYIPRLIVQQMKEQLNKTNKLLKQSTMNYLQEKNNDVTSQSEKVQLLNPELQLKRGFSIATDEQHNIIYSRNQLKLDDVVNVKVAYGKFATKVIDKKGNDV
jgi:exodeoxyribonuclease VII large subunit